MLVVGSYCGTRILAPMFTRGVKAVIATDAGIGKDEAGISGLKHGEEIGVPVAAIAAMSAETSNGRSTLLGEISRANAQARALGVFPGQVAYEAAALLAKAPAGKPIPTPLGDEEAPEVVEETPKGRIWATPGTTAIKEKIPNDVFCSGANSSRVFSDGALRMSAKGAIANDAGIAKNNTAVEGLALLAERGVPAASVAHHVGAARGRSQHVERRHHLRGQSGRRRPRRQGRHDRQGGGAAAAGLTVRRMAGLRLRTYL